MIPGVFVTGTDTGVGKTRISLAILQKIQDQGSVTGVMKPIASGCERTQHGLRNHDALQLSMQCSIDLDYNKINPFAFEPAIAPHIAADQSGIEISVQSVRRDFLHIKEKCDFILVEGAGGWQVPINARQCIADLADCLGLPVLLVVAIRLGCINHAVLTYQSIVASGQTCIGWIANCVDKDVMQVESNVLAIKQRIDTPLLGTVPYIPNASHSDTAAYLTLTPYIN